MASSNYVPYLVSQILLLVWKCFPLLVSRISSSGSYPVSLATPILNLPDSLPITHSLDILGPHGATLVYFSLC